MGTGGEEPLQGAAGITQVRARGHHCGGETLYTRPLVLSLGASSGSWFGVAYGGGGCTWDIQDSHPKSASIWEMWLPDEGLVVVVKPGEESVSFSFSQLILEVRTTSVLADTYMSAWLLSKKPLSSLHKSTSQTLSGRIHSI